MRPLLLSLLLLVAFPASAQASFAVKGGLNTTFFSGDDAVESDPRLGAVGGVQVRVPVTPTVSVQAEALYSQKGDQFENDLGFTEATRLSYVEVPVMVRLGVPLGEFLQGGVVVGGYAGFPVTSEVTTDGLFENELDAATDYGVLVGVDVGSGPFFVEGRYTAGLAEAVEFDPVFEFAPDFRNQAVSFTVGYRFGGPRYYRRF